jgi:hypothetical protein
MSTQTPIPATDANLAAFSPGAASLSEVSAFLAEISRLAAAAQEDAAMDAIFDHVNALLMAGQFARCDELLRLIDVDKVPPVLLISFLTITAPAKDKLAERGHFYDRAKAEIVRRRGPETTARLLVGLE